MRLLRELQRRLHYALRFLIRGHDIPDPEPNTTVLEAELRKHPQYFIVKAEWSEEDQTWLVEMPGFCDGIMTNHDSLPGALYMAGDAAYELMRHDLEYGLYPPKRDNVWAFDAGIPGAFRREWDNPDMDVYNAM